MELVVKAARVADRFASLIPPPKRGGRGLAVGAAGARPPRRTLQRQFWKRKHTDITPATATWSRQPHRRSLSRYYKISRVYSLILNSTFIDSRGLHETKMRLTHELTSKKSCTV